MRLHLQARVQALKHLWATGGSAKGHQIYRLYRWLGWDTIRVGCVCGEIFTPLPKTGSVAAPEEKSASEPNSEGLDTNG